MTYPITKKQLQYLNILLVENIGAENRKPYLKHFYNVDSSKKLTKDQASEIISKFVEENIEREKNVWEAIEKLNKLEREKYDKR